MNNIKALSVFALSLVLLFALAAPVSAQTTMTYTTTTAALDNKAGLVALTSVTGVTGPRLAAAKGGIGGLTAADLTILYIDREAMDVLQDPSGLVVAVKRGTRGTAPAAHASGAKVWVGASGLFSQTDPSGACTRTLLAYVPKINTANGKAWDCMGGKWGNFTDTPQVGTAIASQAGVMTGAYAIIAKVTHITGTAAITGFAVPPGLPDGGTFITIPDAAFTWTAATNIVSTGTAVVGKAIVWTYDATTAKLYPSY